MALFPEVDPASPLQFVINAAAGSSDADAKRAVIETALRAGGRRGELLFCSPAGLARVPTRHGDGEPWKVLVATHIQRFMWCDLDDDSCAVWILGL